MFNWIITYIPLLGGVINATTTEVIGANKLEAQQYFSKYYAGQIVNIERKF